MGGCVVRVALFQSQPVARTQSTGARQPLSLSDARRLRSSFQHTIARPLHAVLTKAYRPSSRLSRCSIACFSHVEHNGLNAVPRASCVTLLTRALRRSTVSCLHYASWMASWEPSLTSGQRVRHTTACAAYDRLLDGAYVRKCMHRLGWSDSLERLA